ncbi:Zinc finger protein [Paramyrothecium foliicola]|nr:Zinc finger protein [Paramyrothecium foliicola]
MYKSTSSTMPSNTQNTNKRKITGQEDGPTVPGTNTNANNSVLAEISVNVRRTPGTVKKQRLQDPAVGVLTNVPVLDDEDDEYVGCDIVVVDEDDEAPQAAVIDQPVIDQNGLIRVGPQPVKAHVFDVKSGPITQAISRFRISILYNTNDADSKLPGFDLTAAPGRREKLLQELQATMDAAANDNYVRRVCDYTGNDLVWTPGPKSMSLEATYPFASHEGVLQYHAAPNAALIMFILNMVKRNHPIIVLPLLAVILNANIQTERPHIAWAFNALCNSASIHSLSGSSSALDMAAQAEMLETRRTGRKTPFLDEKLSESTAKSLFRISSEIKHDRQFSILQNIAKRHELTSDDFEFHLTISSPRSGKRVFYPFHILSRPQAESIGWDWGHIVKMASIMLKRMQKECNKHAQAAGHGEEMDATRVIYWMTGHFARKIRSLQLEFPSASREEIRFRNLDRWGLPIVPWVNNMLHASLCKGPDHGIAMKFGIVEPPHAFLSWDPDRDIDFDKCTITIDTYTTNFGMYKYQTESWPEIREVFASVPLRHPFWRIEESAGQEIWAAASDHSIAPIMPTPDFDVPLVPIDAWFTESVLQLQCKQCNLEFSSAGLLVKHCRDNHGSTAIPPSNDTDQDLVDVDYWENDFRAFKCTVPECTYASAIQGNFVKHMKSAHSTEQPFKCTFPGCTYTGKLEERLKLHERTHAEQLPYPCDVDGCEKAFVKRHLLTKHKKVVHYGEKHHCDEPGCDRKFSYESGLLQHKKTAHGGHRFVCDEPDCDFDCNDRSNLNKHKQKAHGNERHYCDEPGCDKDFAYKADLRNHKEEHSNQTFACDEPGCDKICNTKTKLTRHKRSAHGQKFACDEPGCEFICNDKSNLKRHKRLKHK